MKAPPYRSLLRLVLASCLLAATAAGAHPLPNSVMIVKPGFGSIAIEIHTPAPDLAIAMHARHPGSAGDGRALEPFAVGQYYLRHVGIANGEGRRLPLTVTRARGVEATDPEVGRYSEWLISLVAPAATANKGVYTLTFDAIIHQIPNHIAFVRIEGVGPSHDEGPRDVGVIRYDFASRTIRPLVIDLAAGSMSSGFTSMFAMGFVHVLSGVDHILFLVALLMVVPFVSAGGRWQLQGMDVLAFRHFITISGAFTLGHSVSLAAGTFGLDAIPVRWTEGLVALSIVIAAVHALRPLFPKGEWLVAGGFGLIHGLAFSQSLASLDLDSAAKVGALLGFNAGVEFAQLAVMLISLPLLAISGARFIAGPRKIALLAMALVGLLWIGQRTAGLDLPGWLTL